ncbi:MAG: class B sortase [Gemmiger formicilis]|uniref:class B sortase n=1 Tax=Gemmiger formicilis TaxID=745368 RepID=UPI0039933E39
MPKRYRKLRGDTAYYPFAARTGLRARQRRHVRVLRGTGLAALALAAVLLVRQTVFRGGQPDAPAAVSTAPAVTALPAPTHVTVQPLAATRDALADTQRADASAHTTPETAAVPAAAAGEILPRYRALYEKNPDLIGWLRIDGTDIDLPVVQTPGDNEYYLRRGFDRFYAVGGTLFLDERCSVSADAPTANWLIYGHNMHDGSMFGQLVRYRDEDFYKAHPTFTFDTLYEGGTWQVVAAVDTALGADTLPYYTFFDADTKLDWQHRVRAITEKALYDTGVMPEYGAQLLTLSTCGDTHPDTDARFALLAVRID